MTLANPARRVFFVALLGAATAHAEITLLLDASYGDARAATRRKFGPTDEQYSITNNVVNCQQTVAATYHEVSVLGAGGTVCGVTNAQPIYFTNDATATAIMNADISLAGDIMTVNSSASLSTSNKSQLAEPCGVGGGAGYIGDSDGRARYSISFNITTNSSFSLTGTLRAEGSSSSFDNSGYGYAEVALFGSGYLPFSAFQSRLEPAKVVTVSANGALPPGGYTLFFKVEGTGRWGNPSSVGASGQIRLRVGPEDVAKLRALEVTQVIQDWKHSVPLIAGKRTFARLYLPAATPLTVGKTVTPKLRGFRGGTELPGSPLTPFENSTLALGLDAETNRPHHNLSANFELPSSWSQGTIQLRPEAAEGRIVLMTAQGAPTNTTVSFTFTNVPRPRIAIIPLEVGTPFSTEVAAPDVPAITSAMLRTRRQFPAAELDWQLWETVTAPSIGLPITWLARMNGEQIFHPSTFNEKRVVFGLVRNDGLRTNNSSLEGFGLPGVRIGFANINPNNGGDVVSHELGHIYGRPHAVHHSFGQNTIVGSLLSVLGKRGACGEGASALAEDFPWFYEVGCPGLLPLRPTLGPMDLGEPFKIYGILREASGGLKIADPNCYYEMMSYCNTDRDWVSDWTYGALLAKLVELYGPASPSAPTANRGPRPAGPGGSNEFVLVHGILDFGTGEVSWQPVQCLPYTNAPPAPSPGDCVLKTLDLSGAVLDQVSFEAVIPEDIELSETNMPAPFALAFPMDPAARQLALYYGTNLVSTLNGSSNPPTVHLVSPNGGEVVGTNGLEIRWEVADADGDALTCYVFYSADQGVTWRTLAVDWPGTNLTVRCENLCGSTQALVRVQASDGFYCVADQSDGVFAVPDKGPVIVLAEPAPNAVFYSDQNVTAEAMAVDREDGVLSDSQMEWYSDRHGHLGAGNLLMVSAQPLALGDHVLTCVARDAAGNSNQVSVTIKIVSPPIITAQPASLTNDPGTTATFAVEASGIEPFAYQWTKNGEPLSNGGNISGATTTNLILTGVSQSDAAAYAVVITNLYGNVVSSNAVLTVNPPPTITTQPQSQTVNPGSDVTFTVIASGPGLLTYQWYKDGVLLTNGGPVSGATNATLVLAGVQLSDAGGYTVAVTNSAGTTISFIATLAVFSIVQQAYLKASNTEGGDYFGYSVAISGDAMVIGAPYESSNATNVNGDASNNLAFISGAAYVFVRTGSNWSQQAYLKASNARADDEFGTAVAVSGDTVVVGAPGEDSNSSGVNGNQTNNSASASGAAYVFVRNGTNWSQQAFLKAFNNGNVDNFGISVAVSGDTAVVGARYEDSNATGVNGNGSNNSASISGAAYVFVRSETNWSQQAYLKASNTDSGDQFGSAVALSGDTVVVGAIEEDSNATGVNGDQTNNTASASGAAYVFVRTGTNWSQQAYLKASNTEASDRFGWSVAVSDDTAVVGAYQEDSNATGVNGDQSDNSASGSGAAYVFVRTGTNWSQQAYLKAFNTSSSDLFGASVALSDDKALVGAPNEGAGGAAYLFVRSGTNWGTPSYLKASNAENGDNFGLSVAASGDTAVIGAPEEDSNATGVNGNQTINSAAAAGAAYAFVSMSPDPCSISVPQLAIAPDGSNGIFITFNGVSGCTYRLERASSLAGPWDTIHTQSAPESGHIEYHDTPRPSGQAFYRVARP